MKAENRESRGTGGEARDLQDPAEAYRDRRLEHLAAAAIEGHLPFSADRIAVLAERGRVTLIGEIEWRYQRERAEHAVRSICDSSRVVNLLTLQPSTPVEEIRATLETARR